MVKQPLISQERQRKPRSKTRELREVRGLVARTGPAALDRLIHERIRLGIVSALAVNDSLSFNDLKKLLNTTDGNVSVHARKLEEAQSLYQRALAIRRQAYGPQHPTVAQSLNNLASLYRDLESLAKHGR